MLFFNSHIWFFQVNVGSLENVIRGYLKSAEERTEAARELSQQAVVDIDDLDNITTPESILLRLVFALYYSFSVDLLLSLCKGAGSIRPTGCGESVEAPKSCGKLRRQKAFRISF